jgi:hypothetical protein
VSSFSAARLYHAYVLLDLIMFAFLEVSSPDVCHVCRTCLS